MSTTPVQLSSVVMSLNDNVRQN